MPAIAAAMCRSAMTCRRWWDYAVSEFGGLHALCNNAGLSDNLFGPLLDADFGVFEKIMAVNVMGVMLGTQIAARHMAKHGGGSIINTSSISGIQPGFGFFTYRASKAAVVNFTQSAAIELGPNLIRVNCICPGNIPSEMGAYAVADDPEKQRRIREAVADVRMGYQPLKRQRLPPRYRRGRAVVRQRPFGPGDGADHGRRCRGDSGQPVQPDRRHHGSAGESRSRIAMVPETYREPATAHRIALIAQGHARLLGPRSCRAGAGPGRRAVGSANGDCRAWHRERPAVLLRQPRRAGPVRSEPEQFIGMPSRLSAEAPLQAERQALLDRVSRRGFIDDYAGIRITLTGKRFPIAGAAVWNLLDEEGVRRGQAAAFSV